MVNPHGTNQYQRVRRPPKADQPISDPMPLLTTDLDLEDEDEPPTKRLRTARTTPKSDRKARWIPGGRGGGGRHLVGEEADAYTPRERKPARRNQRGIRRDTLGRRIPDRKRTSLRTVRTPARPRYTTAAAAAATVTSDSYKPREEKSWEEFHPDLDIDSALPMIASELVDGLVRLKSIEEETVKDDDENASPGKHTPSRSVRRPGRPQRTQSSMVTSLLIPEEPKFVPRPGPNPKERLTLPKPSYRMLDPFLHYDDENTRAANFVNQTMANVGYQEHETFSRPENMIRQMEGSADEDLDLMPDLMVGDGANSAIGGNGVGRVEYDMDEQDVKWLEALNKTRLEEGTQPVKPAIFEITMTKVEKEWHALEKRIPKPNPKAPQTHRPRSSSAAAVNGEPGHGEEPDSKCAICDDGDCENANAIVFCDGCDLAVHQECYGVPYIPEGQWLCRKCQLVGNARPSCIFCPHEGGAFKQTNNTKWAHLLCAQWIPEVTIGNPSLMEPITDVEKVPNSRWKLGCYICKQDMGASIQCSDGRCYEPFHLTCARQAGLYLKMKLGGGQNTLMEKNQLRAFCHKHSPLDWKAEHNTDKAFEKAVKHFKVHFQGQIWADSKASALAIADTQVDVVTGQPGLQRLTLTNRKGQKPKSVWRLPSGAPVIPEVVLRTIEDALTRFTVPKKKEFVVELCKYWTLKREARRGAALLKRLQLQMETFSSFEVTRRDYKAQGAAGRARLERRIEFAQILADDLERLRDLCEQVRERELQRLEEARLLREVVDTLYFPIPALLKPTLQRTLKLDARELFADAIKQLVQRNTERYYASVQSFLQDFAKVFENDIGFDAANMANESALRERPIGQLDDADARERRTLARRIMKAAYPLLQEAMRHEAELNGRPFEQRMKEIESLLFSRRASIDQDVSMGEDSIVHKAEPQDIVMDSIEVHPATANDDQVRQEPPRSLPESTPPMSTNGQHRLANPDPPTSTETIQPPTPPMSTKGQNGVVQGGIPWYVEAFDPDGITIYEERWTGKDVLRDLSEELSDMDEDELEDLAVAELDTSSTTGSTVVMKAPPKKKRRGRNGDRAFRQRIR